MSSTKTKRGQGEGSFSKRKDGLWTARKQFGYKENGKPNIKAFYGKTKTEVKKKLDDYQRTMGYSNENVLKETFSEYFKNWFYSFKINTVKPNTADSIMYCYKNRILPYDIATIQMNSLNSLLLQQYINKLVDDGYSLATIKKTYDTINNCLKHAEKVGDISKNYLKNVYLPNEEMVKKKTKEIDFFDEEDMTKIYNEALKKYETGKYVYFYGNAIILLLYSGLRVGEATALKWSDIDFEHKEIHVNKTMSRAKSNHSKDLDFDEVQREFKETSPKTKNANRKIPMTQQAYTALNNLKELNKPYNKETDYVILSNNYQIVYNKNIRRTLNSIQKNAHTKKQNSGLHVLRHSFASYLLLKNVDIKIVSELLGHSKISTTYDIYAHLVKEQKKKAIDLFNSI